MEEEISSNVTKAEIHDALLALEAIEKLNSSLDKENILREASSNPVFKTLVMMAIGPDTYHVRPSEDLPALMSTKQKITTSYQRFITVAEQLRTREITGKKASTRLENFLQSLYPVPKKWFTRVINHNLRIGIGEKTIRNIWGQKITQLGNDSEIIFHKNKCPLSEKYENLKKKKSFSLDFGTEGWYSEAKLDGDRALIFVFPVEKRISVLTRGGKRWTHIENCRVFVKRMLELHSKVIPFTGFGSATNLVFDGEYTSRSGKWNDVASIVRSRVNFDEKKFLQEIGVRVWDWATLEGFNAGIFPMELEERKYTLMKAAGLQKRTAKFTKIVEGVWVVGHRMIYTEDDMWKDNAKKLVLGYEGTVIKNPKAFFVCKRTKDCIKLKPTDDDTGTIVKVISGKGMNSRAKNSEISKVRKVVKAHEIKVINDGYYLHFKTKTPAKLLKELQSEINDATNRRLSCHVDSNTVSYRYSERVGYFVVKTSIGELIRVGGGMTHKAGSDQLMEFWQRREELIGVKVDFQYQVDKTQVAKGRFNKFKRLREDL